MQKQNGGSTATKKQKGRGGANGAEEEETRRDGRCLPLPNDVGRIQNGRAAADRRTDAERTPCLTDGAMDDLRRDRERERERREGARLGPGWSL